MIYLIGGPPKCGKTTLAKKLSRKLAIQWVSSDTLQVVARTYIRKYAQEKLAKLYPHNSIKGKTNDDTYSSFPPKIIAKSYIKQAKTSYSAIEMFSICEIKDGNDYIIEGYHVTPQLVERLMKKYGPQHFRALFLIKSDTTKFVKDVKKSTTPNDWILKKTHKEETFFKIAEMVKYFGEFYEKEAKKRGFITVNMDDNFRGKIKKAMESLSKEK